MINSDLLMGMVRELYDACIDMNDGRFPLPNQKHHDLLSRASEMIYQRKSDVLVDYGKLGRVPQLMAGSDGLRLLNNLVNSIAIIDKKACWDHMAMFDLRDHIVDVESGPKPSAEQSKIRKMIRGVRVFGTDGVMITVRAKFDSTELVHRLLNDDWGSE